MIPRTYHLNAIGKLLNQFPVVCLIGARQVGKTTLARQLIEDEERSVTFFDLEDPTDEVRLSDPKLALEPLRGLVVIDEIQRNEGLFRLLRVLVDRPGIPARFLVLGSAGPILLGQSSESLAGRITYYELPPLRVNEAGANETDRFWLRGGFPPSFLAGNDEDSLTWRTAFIRSSWKEICLNSGYLFLPLPCVDSGLCWPTTTATTGTVPNSAAHLVSPHQR